MAYDPILDSEIQQDDPITTALLQKIKGNFADHETRIAGISSEIIPNGSFEDVDAVTGVPTNWTKALYPGGGFMVLNDASGLHSGKYIRFRSPGGAGNGGGRMTSDYIPCSELNPVVFEFGHKASMADIHDRIELFWYTWEKVSISTSVVYDNSTANPTSWAVQTAWANPPAGAKFFKINVMGACDDDPTAGDSFWDGFRLLEAPFKLGPIMYHRHLDGLQGAAWFTEPSYPEFNIPIKFTGVSRKLRFLASLYWTTSAGGGTAGVRVKVGTNYSNELKAIHAGSGITNSDAVLEVEISNVLNARTYIEIQIYDRGGIPGGGAPFVSLWQIID